MRTIRSDAVIVQIIATEYDDLSRPINEFILPATKVFRASARDFWPQVDQAVTAAVKASQAQQPPASPAPLVAVKKPKREKT